MLEVTERFYGDLYSADDICPTSLDEMVTNIPPSCRLSEDDADMMTHPFELSEILDQVKRSPKVSSPGTDGLSYGFLNLIFKHPKYTELILCVFNDALSGSVFPNSWLETCVCLLPKKGDLTLLKNWRPITLINCDAKIFTRLLNSRLVSVASSLISPWQSGFMKGRFIADNGALAQITLEQASLRQSKEIGLLCDQEKAYDRVHPDYLRAVLVRFGFPAQFVSAIVGLFYGTSMRVNVNGYLTLSVSLGRGLRQGDPVSPLLFNLAMEPLVKAISQSSDIKGFSAPPLSLSSISAPISDPSGLQPIKVLAYADDLLIYLQDQSDLDEVQRLIQCYNQASNAKMNFDKTVAFSVSGLPHPHWLPALASHGITKWHDRRSPEPLTYLGYPLAQSTGQRQLYQDQLIAKVSRACDIHKQRNLSVRGRATVLNTLILSTLWHVLRVSWVSQHTLGILRKLCREFLMFRIFPSVSFDVLQLPLTTGGLGILDPTSQQMALQFRWLTPLLQHSYPRSIVSRWIAAHIASISPIALPDHRLPFLFAPVRRGLLHPSRPGICPILFKAFDAMFDPATVSNETNAPFDQQGPIPLHYVLALPLSAVVLWPPEIPIRQQRSFDNLLVQDAFVFDEEISCVRNKTSSSVRNPITIGRNRILKLLRWISTGTVSLAPFLGRYCLPLTSGAPLAFDEAARFDAFCNSLLSSYLDVHTRVISSKTYRAVRYNRLMASFSESSPVHLRSAIFWKSFWRQPVPLAIRNPWYRLLQNKFPCAELLHKVVPALCPPHCRLCGTNTMIEDPEHFLILCPRKLLVWVQVWDRFFRRTPFSYQKVAQAVFDLHFPPQRLSMVNNGSIIGCTILAIWKAHWRFIFDSAPFDPGQVFQTILATVGPLRANIRRSPL